MNAELLTLEKEMPVLRPAAKPQATTAEKELTLVRVIQGAFVIGFGAFLGFVVAFVVGLAAGWIPIC